MLHLELSLRSRLRAVALAPLVGLLCLTQACSSGAGAPDIENPTQGPGDDGGGSPPGGTFDPPAPPEQIPVEPGDRVGVLTVPIPDADEFTLRGTLPLYRGLWDGDPSVLPFEVRDHDGTPLTTQVEVVSRFPDPADGVDVVEIIARVHAAPSAAEGDHADYDVIWRPRPGNASSTKSIELLRDVETLDPTIHKLLGDTDNIIVRARDAFGHSYTFQPLSAKHGRAEKFGPLLAEVQTYGVMRPAAHTGLGGLTNDQLAVPHGRLKHFFGVHAYLRSLSEEPVLALDLRIHNGFSGLDENNGADDPLGKVYFETLEVLVPRNWSIRQAFDDPGLGAPYEEGDHTVFPLVAELPLSKKHVMPNQGQMHRRLVVARDVATKPARAAASEAGRAFAKAGAEPDGRPWFSWWNPHTARYFAQNYPLPKLDHLDLDALREREKDRFKELSGHVAAGTGKGDYPLVVGRLGWAHPWGVGYGGMTGGNEIQFVDGVELAWTASRQGYRYTQLVHRMQSDRQPAVRFRADGRPSSVEDWLVKTGPKKGYVPFDYYLIHNGKGDPFGLEKASHHQVKYVESTGLQPDYEAQLLEYAPVDFQHYVRYSRSAKVLVWLGNDRLAADDLRMMSEVFHLSYHRWNNNAHGNKQGSGLAALREYAESNPEAGGALGRGQGWGLDCALAYYATADEAWREAKRPWFAEFADVVDLALSCSGTFQSGVNSHGLGGKYRVRQAIEHVILQNALRGMIETVFEGADPARADLVDRILRESHYGAISPMAWSPGVSAPWAWTAVAPLDNNPPAWCSASQLPADWYDPRLENYQLYASLADAYWRTGDPEFLLRAESVLNGDLFSRLLDDGTDNIGNRAPLTALVQQLME